MQLSNNVLDVVFMSYCDPTTSIRMARLSKRFNELLSIHSVDWRLSKRNRVVRFFLKYISRIKQSWLCKNRAMPVEFFEWMIEQRSGYLDQHNLSSNTGLSVTFFKKYIRYVDWDSICSNEAIQVSFFEEHSGSIDWDDIWDNISLPLWFIEKHMARVDASSNASSIWMNKNITIQFAEKYIDKIDWHSICYNPAVPIEFIEKYIDIIPMINKRSLCYNEGVPESFFEKHIDSIDWYSLSANRSLSLEFFMRHADKINWVEASRNPILHSMLLDKHIDSAHWYSIGRYADGASDTLVDVFEKCIGDTNLHDLWLGLCANPTIPISIFEKYLERINWNDIAFNSFGP
jgi:hypothetical protein